MEENRSVLQLFFDMIIGRAKTRVYVTFFTWFLIFHIDIIFIALFTDQTVLFEKNHQLKSEYIWTHLLQFGYWGIALELSRIGLAVLVTYLLIWIIPKRLNALAYEQELDVEYKLREMKNNKEKALIKVEKTNVNEEKGVLEQRLRNIEGEKQVIAEKTRLEETPNEVKWDLEFNDFVKISNSIDALRELSHTVYAEGGNLYQYKAANGWATEPRGIQSDNLALLDTNGLVNFTEKGKILTLTDKGRHFIKRFGSLKSK